MAKRGTEIKALTNVFSEILKVSEQYSYLWDNGFVENDFIGIGGGWIAQDERFSIDVGKYDNKFKIGGKNFAYNYPDKKNKGLSAREAALMVNKEFSRYNIKPEDLKKKFYSGLEEPLGKYLAKKELSDLTN